MQLTILIILCVLFVALIASTIIIIEELHKLRTGIIDSTSELVSTLIKSIDKMTDYYVDAFNKGGTQHAELTQKAVENCNKNYKNTVELVTNSLTILTDAMIKYDKTAESLQETIKCLQNTIRSKTTKKKEIKVE